MSPSIHVAIVEDDAEIRQLLQLIIDGSPGFSCGLVCETAEDALEALPRYRPDLVLMDIHLPGMSGIAAVLRLREVMPELDILMLTVQEDDESVFDSLCAGANGYLLKETPPVELLAAIKEARAGGAPMSGRIARKVVGSFRRKKPGEALSERETEVLDLLCDGQNYRHISEALFISANTVKAHIKAIYKKLHVHNRAEAVKRAIREGWI